MFIRNDANISYIRVLHASPDAPAVDIYVNGAIVFQNLSFKEFSKYVPLSKGNYSVEVYEVNKKDKPVLKQNIEVPEKQVITVAAAGNLEDLELVPYIEGNSEDLEQNESKMRVIHLAPDAPNVDIKINDRVLFKDVGFLDATDYTLFLAGEYNIMVSVADTNQGMLALNPTFKEKKVYTIYILGNVANLIAIQSLDGSTFVRF